MEQTTPTIETLFEKAEAYTKTSIELAKLQAIDKAADLSSSLLSRMMIGGVLGMFLLLVNIGLSFFIGDLLGKIHHGFFIVAVFYLLVAVLLFVFKEKWIKTPISNLIIVKMLKNKTL